jgi:multidrug resistance protein, MATE family
VTVHLPALLAEARTTLKLAWPLILGQLSLVGMGFIDTLMAADFGASGLATIGLGSALWTAPLVFCLGLLSCWPPKVSALRGAGQAHEIANYLRHVALLGVFGVVVLAAVALIAPLWLELAKVESALRPDALAYLHAVQLGAPHAV